MRGISSQPAYPSTTLCTDHTLIAHNKTNNRIKVDDRLYSAAVRNSQYPSSVITLLKLKKTLLRNWIKGNVVNLQPRAAIHSMEFLHSVHMSSACLHAQYNYNRVTQILKQTHTLNTCLVFFNSESSKNQKRFQIQENMRNKMMNMPNLITFLISNLAKHKNSIFT